VARGLGYEPSLSLAPPKRVAEIIRARGADLLCHVSPDWYPDPGLMDFGTTLYQVRGVLVGRPDVPDICDGCTPAGLVATVAGYNYGPALAAAFASGTASRSDVRTEQAVYLMVRRDRVAYGILPDLTFQHLSDGADRLVIKGRVTGFPVTVATLRGGRIAAEDLRRVTATVTVPDRPRRGMESSSGTVN
jgi:hypothetical protein